MKLNELRCAISVDIVQKGGWKDVIVPGKRWDSHYLERWQMKT